MGHKSNRRIAVNSVSLVNLKAEIARRQVEVKSQATILNDGCKVIPPSQSSISSSEDSSKSVFRRVKASLKSAKERREEKQQPKTESFDLSVAEQAELDRIRKNLEAKAKLYDALQQAAVGPRTNTTADDDEAPLVDFERKAMESGVPYHYDYCSSSDDDREEGGSEAYKKRETSPVRIPDGPVTYAHLRQGEVRDHGVGFYGFSEDADTRASEQAALRELRRATEKARQVTDKAKAKRDIQMAKRLAKLRARKGLPDVATAAAKCLGASVVTNLQEMPTSEADQQESQQPGM